jgi:hypothetical protein
VVRDVCEVMLTAPMMRPSLARTGAASARRPSSSSWSTRHQPCWRLREQEAGPRAGGCTRGPAVWVGLALRVGARGPDREGVFDLGVFGAHWVTSPSWGLMGSVSCWPHQSQAGGWGIIGSPPGGAGRWG